MQKVWCGVIMILFSGSMIMGLSKSELKEIEASLSADSYTGWTKLHDAIDEKKSLEVVRYLVEQKKEDVNAIASEMLHLYKPVLGLAIAKGTDPESVAIIKFLLDHDARINGVDIKDTGGTPAGKNSRYLGFMPLINFAVAYSSPEVVQLLIDYGADVNPRLTSMHKGYKGAHTPLCLAYQRGDEAASKIAEILKKAGAKQDYCGWWDRFIARVRSWFR